MMLVSSILLFEGLCFTLGEKAISFTDFEAPSVGRDETNTQSLGGRE